MEKFLISSAIFVLFVVACGVGSNPTISATASSGCNNIQSATCTINLTYNTNGQAGLSLGINFQPTSYTDFNTSGIESCVVTNQPYTQTCNFPITYKSGSGQTQKMVFTLGSAKSNSVYVRD